MHAARLGRRNLGARVACFVVALGAVAAAEPAGALVDRGEDPVVVAAALLPDFAGTAVDEFGVFRYDASSGTFVPIPFQVDERVDHALSPGTPNEVHETIYDVLGEDDGLLDALDELAFLYSDTGGAAPPATPWVAGAGPNRFEIKVADPRPGGPYPDRFAYIFTGTGLPASPVTYVTWSGSATAGMSSSRFALEFSDRWLLTGYRVAVPCGSGGDLVDRVKGRAGIAPDRAESEELWNSLSTFLGGITGPVRAIRYVQGAASAVNTLHHDVMYRGLWERVINLRVHPVSGIWLYTDLRPGAGTTFLAPSVPAGVPVDGVNDAAVGTTPKPWTLVRGPSGGFATLYDNPPSPFVASTTFYYRDDAGFDDQSITEPTYTDEDNSAYGNHGVKLTAVTGQSTDTIPASLRTYALCANEGDAAAGTAYRELFDVPLVLTATLQTFAAPAVAGLSVSKAGFDLVLTWPAIPNVTSYRVYSTSDASLPHGSWTLLASPVTPPFQEAGALADPTIRFYSVTAVTAAGEGPW